MSTKKSLSFLMAACMVCSISVSSVMANNLQDLESDRITFEEFSSALTQEFEQYGIEFEAKQTDETFVYTKDILEQELEKARAFGQSYLESRADSSQIPNPIESMFPLDNGGIDPFNMPGTISKYNDSQLFLRENMGNIVLLPATVKVRTFADIDVNFHSDSITGGTVTSLEVRAATYAQDYVVLKSYSKSINNASSDSAKRYITFNITAEFKQDYTIPGGSSWTKVEQDYSTRLYPFD